MEDLNYEEREQNFKRGLEKFKHEPDSTYREAQEYYELLIQAIENKCLEAEEGVTDSPAGSVDIEIYRHRIDVNNFTDLLSLSIAHGLTWLKDAENEIEELKQSFPKTGYLKGSKYPRIVSLACKKFDNGFNLSPPNGKFVPGLRNHAVLINTIPRQFFRDQLADIPEILQPFIYDKILNHNTENLKEPSLELEGLIIHEMTHAYIENQTGLFRGEIASRNRELNEGAAHATASIKAPWDKIATDSYQEKGQSRAYLQWFKQLFLTYSERFDSEEEKIYQIRKKAVETMAEMRKKKFIESLPDTLQNTTFEEELSVVDMIIGQSDKELEKLGVALRMIEEGKSKAMHSLVMLNILMPGDVSEYDEKIDVELNKVLSEPLYDLLPEGDSINLKDNPTLIGKVASKSGIKVPRDSREWRETDFENTLKELNEGISELYDIADDPALSREENRKVRRAANDLEKAIGGYLQEDKVESEKGEELAEKYGGRSEEVIKWCKSRISLAEYTDPVYLSEGAVKELSGLIDDFLKFIDVGINYNSELIKAFEKLHNDEGDVQRILSKYGYKEEYQDLNEMLILTKKLLKTVKGSQEQLKEAQNIFRRAEQTLS